jgi:hypothetical protein
MKKVVATVVAVSLAAAVAAPMAAEARTKKKVRTTPSGHSGQTYSAPRSDYQEAIADKLPFGSSQWWVQMDREGRGGQSRAN